MLNKNDNDTELGLIRIHNDAISSCVAIAAEETEGVKSVGRNLKSSLLCLLSKKSTAIKVDIDKNGEVKVDVPLVVRYGYSIPEVASRVQENVRSALERTTNLSLKDINIIIKRVEK